MAGSKEVLAVVSEDRLSNSVATQVVISTLVVDDSVAMLREMCRCVEALPSLELVGTAENGRQALEQCESLMPQLVLMDFQMPEMNGLQAARKIKSDKGTRIKVIVVTIHDNPRLREAVLSSGVDGFLSKAQLRKELPKELGRLFPC
jgi:DNA-binding NarL/FixJ family response regulator